MRVAWQDDKLSPYHPKFEHVSISAPNATSQQYTSREKSCHHCLERCGLSNQKNASLDAWAGKNQLSCQVGKGTRMHVNSAATWLISERDRQASETSHTQRATSGIAGHSTVVKQ